MIKTKLKKNKGWYRLVVDDGAINKLYECSQSRPIVLAVMSNFFDSGCWSVEDFRLSKYKTPSEYFEGSDLCRHEVKTEAEKEKLTARLHTFRQETRNNKQYIVWDTFDKAVHDGDNPSCKDARGHEYNITARFTYAAAMAKMDEIKQYWNEFQGTDLMEGKIPNPHRQISEMTLLVESMKAEELGNTDNTDNTTKKKKVAP